MKGWILRTVSGTISNSIYRPIRCERTEEVALGPISEKRSTESFGFCEPERPGRIFPNVMELILRCIGVSKDGEKMLLGIAQDVKIMDKLDLRECFIDGTFVPSKKGALVSGRQSAVKGARSWRWQTLMVFQSPLAQQALGQLE
jgi:hypothetical protein